MTDERSRWGVWEPLPSSPDGSPRFRHTCGGTVSLWRSKSSRARDRAYCCGCGHQWERPDARYRWRRAQA